MAVFQGARLRSTALPAADAAPGRPRVAAPATVRATPRVRPMGVLMAAIVVTTMLGLVYLTQTLGSNATSSEIRELETDRAELIKDWNRHVITVADLIEGDVIIREARGLGLKKLGKPVVLRAP